MKIPRVKNISEEKFIEDYLLPNKPVIVTDAMENWDMQKFTPEYLKKTFGNEKVQVYNDLFDLQTIQSLEKYIDTNFFKSEKEVTSNKYMRWYTKLKEVEFYWSDKVFDALKKSWDHPYFIPQTSLAIPISENAMEGKNVNEFNYPYKGLFISGRGSRTRLHKDPFASNAVLCQFYGEKKIYLFNPDKEFNVMNQRSFVDVKNPDYIKFPNYLNTTFDFEDILMPGEIVFFPSGWFHDVTCLSDSISITWNFVHTLQVNVLCNHIENNPEDDQLEIVKFFLKDKIDEKADSKQIHEFFKNKFVKTY